MRQYMTIDANYYRHLDCTRIFVERKEWIFPEFVELSQAVQTLSTYSELASSQLFATIDDSHLPVAFNVPHFFTHCIRFRQSAESPSTDAQREYLLPFKPFHLKQINGGLVVPVNTWHVIAAQGTQESKLLSESSSSSSPHPIPPPASLLPLTPPTALSFPVSVQRMISLTSAMRHDGSVWTFRLDPNFLSLAAYQPHPFLIRWPTNRAEMQQMIKLHFPEFQTECHENSSDSSSNDSICSCGGERNPDTLLNDADLQRSMYGWTNAETDEYIQPDDSHHTIDNSWQCELRCPDSHREASGRECLCLDHLHSVRGCIWWNCRQGFYLIVQLVFRMMGLKQKYHYNVTEGIPRPGHKGDWKLFFESLPPFTTHQKTLLRPISDQVQKLLSFTLPWSTAASVTGEEVCMPAPAILAAPIAPGWVGGFIASSTDN